MFDELIDDSMPSNDTSSDNEYEPWPGNVQQAVTPLSYTTQFQADRSRFLADTKTFVSAMRHDSGINLGEVDLRYSTAINLRRLKSKRVAIIGLGGIGSWVAQTLAGMGVEDLVLIDDDIVEIHNVGPQAYFLSELGLYKVEAMRDRILQFRGVVVDAVCQRVHSLTDLIDAAGEVDIVIGAVDNMDFRNGFARSMGMRLPYRPMAPRDGGGTASVPESGYVFDKDISTLHLDTFRGLVKTLPDLYIDLRMGLGMWNAYSLPLKELAALPLTKGPDVCRYIDGYAKVALFPDSLGDTDPCTERAIIYTGANIASYTAAMIHWFVDQSGRFDIQTFFSPYMVPGKFTWLKSFHARSWMEGTPRKPRPVIIEPDPVTEARAAMLQAQLSYQFEAHRLNHLCKQADKVRKAVASLNGIVYVEGLDSSGQAQVMIARALYDAPNDMLVGYVNAFDGFEQQNPTVADANALSAYTRMGKAFDNASKFIRKTLVETIANPDVTVRDAVSDPLTAADIDHNIGNNITVFTPSNRLARHIRDWIPISFRCSPDVKFSPEGEENPRAQRIVQLIEDCEAAIRSLDTLEEFYPGTMKTLLEEKSLRAAQAQADAESAADSADLDVEPPDLGDEDEENEENEENEEDWESEEDADDEDDEEDEDPSEHTGDDEHDPREYAGDFAQVVLTAFNMVTGANLPPLRTDPGPMVTPEFDTRGDFFNILFSRPVTAEDAAVDAVQLSQARAEFRRNLEEAERHFESILTAEVPF